MKVGGNESATKYFQSHGGSAALASKDPKVKYGSSTAAKYKEELKKRSAEDAKLYPGEVVVEGGDEPATPAETEDDFFSSWDKPSIKRPTPPPSRTATPPVIGRTSSPLVASPAAGGADIARTKSPLTSGATTPETTPPVSRTTTSSALRTKAGGASASGARRTGVLGAKKPQKLGAKKVTGGDVLDFEEAEKKAKEEAERIAKLGYNPDDEEVKDTKAKPLSPAPASSASSHQRQSSDTERLGLQMGRLGFGQTAGAAAAVTKPAARNTGGFGSVGPVKAAVDDDDEKYARTKFGTQKGISSDEFFGKGSYDPTAQSEAKTRLQGFEGASSISSSQYFGRDEDERVGNAGGDDFSNLEVTAREFARRFAGTASEDLENAAAVIGQGASRLQDVVRQYMR